MNGIYQLEFFDDDVGIMRRELKAVKESNEKVRKGLFARHNELAKMYVELHNRFEVIEKNICRKRGN